jgi:hypothetical protein
MSRPAGESTRLRMDELYEGLGTWLSVGSLVVLGCALVLLTMVHHPLAWVVLGALYACFLYLVWKRMRKLARDFVSYKQGFEGERYVGQQLSEELLPLGFRVFHDLDFKTYNMDHVVVGPGGVFVVETKAWSKARDGSSEVTYADGKLLSPWGKEFGLGKRGLEQVRANAQTLSSFLRQHLNKEIKVHPVLALPGHFIKGGLGRDIWVINPIHCGKLFSEARFQELSVDLQEAISAVVREKTELDFSY